MKTKLLIAISSFLLLPFGLSALHLLGGTISYKHITGDEYEITVHIYRDCFLGGAPFDSPINIALYRGTQGAYDLYEEFSPIGPIVNIITTQQDDCPSIAFPFCFEKGTYSFNALLPDTGEDYLFVHQRCCKSATYTNLDSPGEVGFTVSSEISSDVLQLNNSSPTLADLPLLEICMGDEFSFDLSASDSEADSIIYEWIQPINGGGPSGAPGNPGDPEDCEGVQPNPPCPPPFGLVDFASSLYSFDQMLGTNSILELDRTTGIISGVAQNQGQFLGAIAVKEYVDGNVISTSIQEVTFYVNFATSLSTPEVKPLSFYPNPAQEKVMIELPEHGNWKNIIVRDIQGNIVQTLTTNGNQHELDIHDLKGLYFIEVQDKDQVYLGKLVAL